MTVESFELPCGCWIRSEKEYVDQVTCAIHHQETMEKLMKMKTYKERLEEIFSHMDPMFVKAVGEVIADAVDDCVKGLDSAWGLIANAGGGDWEKETPEWRTTATRWKKHYLKFIKEHNARRLVFDLDEIIESIREGKVGFYTGGNMIRYLCGCTLELIDPEKKPGDTKKCARHEKEGA